MTDSWNLMLRAMWDKPSRNGYPIYLRFKRHGQRVPWFMKTGKHVQDKDSWNDNLKMVAKGKNFRLINAITNRLYDEAKERLLHAEALDEPLTEAVFRGKKLIDFESFAKEVFGDNKQARGYLKKGRRFNGGKVVDKKIVGGEIDIKQINITWLRRFQAWLVDEDGYAHNSMVNCLKFYRQVCNQAQREGFIKVSPFGLGKFLVPEYQDSVTVFLMAKERNMLLNGLLNNEILNPKTHAVLAYFMLGVFGGIRYSDWAVFDVRKMIISEPNGDFLLLKTEKTDDIMRMVIGKSLAKVLDVIRKIGPLKVKYNTILDHLKKIKDHFRLDKDLGTHVARHSFGYLCAAMGVPKSTTALWMGITEETVETYYHLTGDSVKEHSEMMADV